MKAFAQEPGDPQTSLPSTLRLATLHPLLHKATQSTFRGVRRGAGSIDQSTRVDLWWIAVSARASSCYRPGSDSDCETERDQSPDEDGRGGLIVQSTL